MQDAYSWRQIITCFKRVFITKVVLEWMVLSDQPEILLALAAKVAIC